jgi:hypothetical protein
LADSAIDSGGPRFARSSDVQFFAPQTDIQSSHWMKIGNAMFRHNGSIRLTSIDVVLFARVTDADCPPPITVADYNRRLVLAAQHWGQESSTGARWLAKLACDMMLDPLDPTDVLDNGQLDNKAYC